MILDAQILEGYPNRVMGGLMCSPSLTALCSVPHMSLMMCSCKTVDNIHHADGPTWTRRHPHTHGRIWPFTEYTYSAWATSASRRCRAPRTNSPREWGRSRADPEEAVMIKAVIPD